MEDFQHIFPALQNSGEKIEPPLFRWINTKKNVPILTKNEVIVRKKVDEIKNQRLPEN